MESVVMPLRPRRSKKSHPTHTDEMFAYVIKQAPTPRSKQIPDVFSTLYTSGRAVEPPIDPLKLLILTEENSIHAACLLAKTFDSVGRGWNLSPRSKTTTPEVDGKSLEEIQGTLRDKLDDICQDLTFEELLFQASWEIDAIGWAAWEVARDDNDKLGGIFPVPAHTIRATKDRNIYVQIRGAQTTYFKAFGYEEKISAKTGERFTGGQYDEEANEILVFRTYSPRSQFYGVPRWISAVSAIAELTAIREFNVSFFSSGGMADAVIHVKASTLVAAEKIGNTIMKGLGESRGAQGHTSVVTGGDENSDVVVRFMAPGGKREGQFTQRRDGLINEVLVAHQVPPYRIGLALLGSLGGSTASEMLRTYRIGVVEPRQGLFESRLNKTLFGPKGLNLRRFDLEWMLSDISWDETELNLDIAVKSVQFGMYTPNEGRVQMGKEKLDIPEMDRVYMNSALQPLVVDQTATPDPNTPADPNAPTDPNAPPNPPNGATPATATPPNAGPNLHGAPKPPAPKPPGANGAAPSRRPGATRGPAPLPNQRDRGKRGGTGIAQLMVNPATDKGD